MKLSKAVNNNQFQAVFELMQMDWLIDHVY